MTYTDLAAQARSYSRTASAATRRAERDAHRAQAYYTEAAHWARLAAMLTQQPQRWLPEIGYTPASQDDTAREYIRLGDTFLRRSFSATDSAAFYRDLAARYREMAAKRAARMAATA
jgi:hypothetical protein